MAEQTENYPKPFIQSFLTRCLDYCSLQHDFKKACTPGVPTRERDDVEKKRDDCYNYLLLDTANFILNEKPKDRLNLLNEMERIKK